MKTTALTRPLADRLADGDFTLHEIGEACIRYPAKSANRSLRRRALAEFSFVSGISNAQRLTFTQLTAALASLDRTSALAPETITRIRRDVIGAVRSSRLVPILTAHKEPLDKEWEHVAGCFEQQKLPKDAKRLAKWAVIRSIAPAEVNDKVLHTFLRDLSKVFNQLQSYWLAGRISLAWNDIARDKALALQCLSPIVSDRRYRLARFPASIEHDIESYQRSLTSIVFDPMDERGRFKSLNSCSSMQSIKNLRAAVDAYCMAGGSLNNGDNLSVLATPQALHLVMLGLDLRLGENPSDYKRQISRSVIDIARRFRRASNDVLIEMNQMMVGRNTSRVRSNRFETTCKILLSHDARRRVINAPSRLRFQAAASHKLSLAMQLYQTATAIDILLIVPLKPKSLAALEFGSSVMIPIDRDLPVRIKLPDKDSSPADEMPLDEHASNAVRSYFRFLKSFVQRPQRLFISVDAAKRPKDRPTADLSHMIARFLKEATEIRLTAGQVRFVHLIARLIDEPSDVRLLQQTYGYKSVNHFSMLIAGLTGINRSQLLSSLSE